MPNRIIGSGICASDTLNLLRDDAAAEVLFYRLIVVADDFGRFDGRLPIIRAACYPLRDEEPGMSGRLAKWLDELESATLIRRYAVAGRAFLCITKWEQHQRIRTVIAKFPAPPDGIDAPREKTLPLESDVEDEIVDRLSAAEVFCGRRIVGVDRQARIGNSYADIVIRCDGDSFVIELKRGRITHKAISQAQRYAATCGGKPIVIGCGVAADVDIEQVGRTGVALISYSEAFEFSMLNSGGFVIPSEMTLFDVKSTSERHRVSRSESQSITNPITNPESQSNARDLSAAPTAPIGVRPEVWDAWKKHRRKLSPHAIELQARKLSEFAAAGSDPNAVIEQSICNGWTGLFPVKVNERGPPNGSNGSRANRRADNIDRLTGQDRARQNERFAGTAERMDRPTVPSLPSDLREPPDDDVR